MKVLLIEDRPDRQKLFLPNKEKDIETLSKIEKLWMPIDNECKEIIDKINKEDFDTTDLKLIMIHKSALIPPGVNYLIEQSEKKKINLVFFSGSIDQTIYNNENFEFLNMNSKEFYSDNLIPFLVDFISEENTQLLFLKDKNWRLSYLFLFNQLYYNYGIEKDQTTKDRLEDTKKILGINKDNFEEVKKDIDLEINQILLNL
jgi:hypothetical protein